MLSIPTSMFRAVDDEAEEIGKRLANRLRKFNVVNARQDSYYEAKQLIRDLGIAIPPHLRDLEAAVGWPAMAVDVLGERLTHDGWRTPDTDRDLRVDQVVTANQLNRELRSARIQAMRYGVSFGAVGKGDTDADEPDPLMTVESPTRMTVTWDRRRRRVTEALLLGVDEFGRVSSATLWHYGRMIELTRDGRDWHAEVKANPLRYPPVVRFVNRYSVGATDGQSEITRPLRTATDNAVRTVVAMEISREFHAAPKVWLMGADESQFVDAEGNPKSAWETYIGRLNAIPGPVDENGDPVEGTLPTIEHLAGASPAPFLEQLRGLAQMVSAETAMPISYLGLVHDANPASADAAHVAEARLNLRGEQRRDDFAEDEALFMRLALWVRDSRDPGVTPRPIYRPLATPTQAAAADATVKLVNVDVLPADSEVTQKRVGLDEQDRKTLADERRRERIDLRLSALGAAADAARREDAAARTEPSVA